MDSCPVKKRAHQLAKCIGSAPPGLGFYHVEAPELGPDSLGNMRNCGIVYVESGEISKEE